MELEEDDCKHMACNWKGIMPGKTGRVWVTEALNQDGSSQGLKIKNGLTENFGEVCPHSWRCGTVWENMRLYNREGIPIRDALTPKEYRQILRNVRCHPKEWYLRLRSPQVPGIMVSADKIIVFHTIPAGLHQFSTVRIGWYQQFRHRNIQLPDLLWATIRRTGWRLAAVGATWAASRIFSNFSGSTFWIPFCFYYGFKSTIDFILSSVI